MTADLLPQKKSMTNIKDLETRDKPNWCPGCGDHGILMAVKQAIAASGIEPHNIAISTGIGCGSKLNQWVNTYGNQGLHGRGLPVAMGMKLANPEITVLSVGGDGDGYGIGMGHFINNMRRNIDITYIVQDNQTYGLTLGQTSPTSDKGATGPSTPFGVIEEPVNPIRLALSSDCTFVARGFAGDIPHLADLILQGMQHKGFALIDVLQPCATFNKVNTYKYFRERVKKLENHDVTDLNAAFAKADGLDIGVFYKVSKPTYEDQEPGLRGGHGDVNEVMASFM